VVVSKYVDHLPLRRLEGIFARGRIDLPRSTLCGWVADVATVLTPIGEQLRREITAADYLQTDDTSITVLAERGGSSKGRLWIYLDPLTNQVVFDATTTHERDGPAVFLAPFHGALQADAYSGYDGLYQSGRVIEIGCWAHARRRFVEVFMIDTAAALMIALIQQLYQVEHASRFKASSRMGASRSITTAPKTSSVLSRWAARIGYSQAASKAPDARRSSIRSFRAANSSTSRRFCT
jgi:hypothetical protein